MGVYLDAADLLSEDDWDDLRKEALANLMEKGTRYPGHALSDLIDARDALVSRRHVEALNLLERALRKIKDDL